MARRRKTEYPPRFYLDYYTDVIQLLTANGYVFPTMGPLLSAPAISLLNRAAEAGERATEFAGWLLREQQKARPVPVDERDPMGNETIAPSEAA